MKKSNRNAAFEHYHTVHIFEIFWKTLNVDINLAFAASRYVLTYGATNPFVARYQIV